MKKIIIAIILILVGCGGYADELAESAEENSEILEVLEISEISENLENSESDEPTGPERPLGPAMIEMAMEVEEILGNNPWFSLTDEQLAELTTLPVFVNPLLDWVIREGAADISTEQAIAVVQNLADFFGYSVTNWNIDDNPFNIHIMADLDNAETDTTDRIIFWGNNLRVGIWLDNETPFRDENFPFENFGNSRAESEEIIIQIFDHLNLADFLGIEGVLPSVTYSHMIIPPYTARGEFTAFAAPSDSVVEEILSYNFRRMGFSHFEKDEDGSFHIWFDLPDLAMSQPFGDFPIISADEARAALLAGVRASSIHEDYWPGDEYGAAAAVELVYLRGQYYEFFRPYYLFYVEMPPYVTGWGEMGGRTAFGYWFVPAIDRAAWDYELMIVFN
ncbi:MAG: hypothetical protein FWG65_12975 [Turicibacter sp.]|nr:hypothetical protein [Turicibacter sp.]